MTTLNEIKAAADQLPREELFILYTWMKERLATAAPDATTLSRGQGSHSVLDIPVVSLGRIIRPLTPDDDILGEMLEGRFGRRDFPKNS
jgi:hypothetical protein